MAADEVKADLLETAELTETGGFVSDVIRTFYLKGVPGTAVGTVILNALTDASVPVAGSVLSDDFPNMRASTRTAQIITPRSGGKADVKVLVRYESMPQGSAEATYIVPSTPAMQFTIPLRGGASLSQITTSKSQGDSEAEPPVPPQPYKVKYVHGDVSIEYPVSVDVYDVHGTFVRETVEFTNDPDAIVYDWINHVNLTMFRGKPPKTWLCSDIQYELVNQRTSPMHYKFTWQFEYRPSTWVYDYYHKDDDGKIPDDVVIVGEGNGHLIVEWHKTKEFNTKFAFPNVAPKK